MGHQLAILTKGKPRNWPQYLEQIALAFRSTPHPSTGETPFFLMFGYDPQMPAFSSLEILERSARLEPLQEEARDRLRSLKEARQHAFENLLLFYEKSKEADLTPDSRTISYEKGQLILVRVSQVELKDEPSRKLALKWTGPYRVAQKFSNGLTYRVKSLETNKEKIVHVGNTRPFIALQANLELDVSSLQLLQRAIDPEDVYVQIDSETESD